MNKEKIKEWANFEYRKGRWLLLEDLEIPLNENGLPDNDLIEGEFINFENTLWDTYLNLENPNYLPQKEDILFIENFDGWEFLKLEDFLA